MPYASKAQQGYLHAKKPDVAKKYDTETPKSAYAKMPAKVKSGTHHGKARQGRKG